MSGGISLAADLLVATLLVVTISTSLVLSRRIARLKADEATMQKTIAELMVATGTAERAIAGLRGTLDECDRTLADRLKTAERYAVDLAERVGTGEAVMDRITRIVEAARQVASVKPVDIEREHVSPAAVKLRAAAARAEALAARAVRRLESDAA